MSSIELIKHQINFDITDDLLIAILFEMSRYYDKKFTNLLKGIKKEKNIVFDTPTRKQLRLKYYYGNNYKNFDLKYNIEPCTYNNEKDIQNVIEDTVKRLNTYSTEKIIESIKKRFNDLTNGVNNKENIENWLKIYEERRKDKKFSMASLLINQKIFKEANYNENYIINYINKIYDSLENYRYLTIIIENDLFDKDEKCVTWKMMYKAGIYAENFMQYKDKFVPFKKEKQTKQLVEFLKSRNIKNAEELATEFYDKISYGFKFEDCYISKDQSIKIMIYKKIKLDNTNVPCPSCNTIIQRGNSYPELFLRSWECQNPSCPDRSKSGRGKRFDEYGVYRYLKLVENKKENRIDEKFYQKWRRDIFDSDLEWKEFILREYTYAGENVFVKNYKIENQLDRNIISLDISKNRIPDDAIDSFEKLPIFKLLKNIKIENTNKNDSVELKKSIEILNENSTQYIAKLLENQIGTAITSPPYYNAREYSQWNNLVLYLIDMMINSKNIYDKMLKNSYYLYNIGDIVCEDNVYVESNMSKRRIQLGFLSCMIFEISGFNVVGNIIWDKGEVQSKRNSTQNMFSGYVKCINCYEHVLVFRKGEYEKNYNNVVKITPVIKINSKGENLYKHTAPFPTEVVNLVKPFVQENYYILDPFLGSGTTLKWCKENNFKGVGFELNSEYYNLCLNNINNNEIKQVSLL